MNKEPNKEPSEEQNKALDDGEARVLSDEEMEGIVGGRRACEEMLPMPGGGAKLR